MAFTGKLGTSDSQLGSIILGQAGQSGMPSGSFTADAVLLHIVSTTITADAVIGSSSVNGSFGADAFIAYTLWTDDFNRSVIGGIGTSSDGNTYSLDSGFTGAGADINGSEISVIAGGADRWKLNKVLSTGVVQYDFWVPANTSDSVPYYELALMSSPATAGKYQIPKITVYPNGDGTWSAYVSGLELVFTPTASTWYTVKANVGDYSAPAGQLALKVWDRSATEPGTWGATRTQAQFTFAFTQDYPTLEIDGGAAEASKVDNLLISGILQGIFSANAVIKKTTNKTYTANARLRTVISRTFTSDSTLRGTLASSITADANIFAPGVGQFTADSVLLNTFEATVTADASIVIGGTTTFTADAYLSAAGFTDNIADVNTIVIPESLSFTTDFSAFTTEADDPAEIADYTNGLGFTGWIKLHVPTDGRYELTTDGSGMSDTVMFIYAGVPNSASTFIAYNDDATTSWSRIETSLSAGDYYVCVQPWSGPSWNTAQATVTLNITNITTINWDGVKQPAFATDIQPTGTGPTGSTLTLTGFGISAGTFMLAIFSLQNGETVSSDGTWTELIQTTYNSVHTYAAFYKTQTVDDQNATFTYSAQTYSAAALIPIKGRPKFIASAVDHEEGISFNQAAGALEVPPGETMFLSIWAGTNNALGGADSLGNWNQTFHFEVGATFNVFDVTTTGGAPALQFGTSATEKYEHQIIALGFWPATADAVLSTTTAQSFNADAALALGFFANAVLLKPTSGTFLSNAALQIVRSGTWTGDSTFVSAPVQWAIFANARLVKTTPPVQSTRFKKTTVLHVQERRPLAFSAFVPPKTPEDLGDEGKKENHCLPPCPGSNAGVGSNYGLNGSALRKNILYCSSCNLWSWTDRNIMGIPEVTTGSHDGCTTHSTALDTYREWVQYDSLPTGLFRMAAKLRWLDGPVKNISVKVYANVSIPSISEGTAIPYDSTWETNNWNAGTFIGTLDFTSDAGGQADGPAWQWQEANSYLVIDPNVLSTTTFRFELSDETSSLNAQFQATNAEPSSASE